jgi:hypothetical protein
MLPDAVTHSISLPFFMVSLFLICASTFNPSIHTKTVYDYLHSSMSTGVKTKLDRVDS